MIEKYHGNRSFNSLYILVFFFISVLSEPHSLVADDNIEQWNDTKAAAQQEIEKGNCDEVWNLVWPWAKKGNYEARFTLAAAIAFNGLTPPGDSIDLVSRHRHITILIVFSDPEFLSEWIELYGILYNEVAAKMLRAVNENAFLEYEECRSSESFKKCSSLVVELLLLPSFDEYAKQIDRDTLGDGNKLSASCPK